MLGSMGHGPGSSKGWGRALLGWYQVADGTIHSKVPNAVRVWVSGRLPGNREHDYHVLGLT